MTRVTRICSALVFLSLAIACAPGGPVCAGTEEHGLSCLDGRAWTGYNTADGLAGNGVNAVAPDGAVWFGTSGHGVSRFDGTA